MSSSESYEEFQRFVFDELDALEKAADLPKVKIVLRFSDIQVSQAAARGLRIPREASFIIPEKSLAAIEPDQTKWSEAASKALSLGISRRWGQIQQAKKRKE
jgi:hypothetical protein